MPRFPILAKIPVVILTKILAKIALVTLPKILAKIPVVITYQDSYQDLRSNS